MSRSDPPRDRPLGVCLCCGHWFWLGCRLSFGVGLWGSFRCRQVTSSVSVSAAVTAQLGVGVGIGSADQLSLGVGMGPGCGGWFCIGCGLGVGGRWRR